MISNFPCRNSSNTLSFQWRFRVLQISDTLKSNVRSRSSSKRSTRPSRSATSLSPRCVTDKDLKNAKLFAPAVDSLNSQFSIIHSIHSIHCINSQFSIIHSIHCIKQYVLNTAWFNKHLSWEWNVVSQFLIILHWKIKWNFTR